jgi:hypothetical protein
MYPEFWLAVGLLAGFAAILRLFQVRFLSILALTLLGFVAVELILSFIPLDFFGGCWWYLHAPSITVLGFDEILERYGWIVSTAAHAADLLLWSVLLAGILTGLQLRSVLAGEPPAPQDT